MDGDHRRQAAAAVTVTQVSPARRLIAWLRLLFRAFVHRYGKVASWNAAGRPVFVVLAVFFLQRSLRRRYLSWKESSRLPLMAAAAVTVQTTVRAMAAQRELSVRKQTRAATRIQAQWRAHRAVWSYLTTKRAAVICQRAWRQSVARKELRKLRLCVQENLEREMLEEVCRLREMVDVLQQAVNDAETRAVNEREAAKDAMAQLEAASAIEETVVMVEDTEKVKSLSAEVDRLKDLLGAEMSETFAAKKALSEAELRNEKLARLLGVEEVKNKRLQDTLKRMEEKASSLDEENRMLRQAVASNPAIVRSPSGENHEAPGIQAAPDNEKSRNGTVKPIAVDREANVHEKGAEQPSSNGQEAGKQQQELLIKCLSEDLGFSVGRPIAAYLIYRCLVHWRSFEEERSVVFDRIIQKITAALEARDNNDALAYWLSNSCALLVLLQRTLKINGVAALARQRRRTSSPLKENQDPAPDGQLICGLAQVYQVEAKYPAIAFKQQLTALLEKVYGMIRHNLKKELSPLLGLCIQAPRTFVVSPRGSCSQGTDLAQQASMAHWQSIIKILTNSLDVLKSNYVPPFLICKMFTQVFSFINVQLFNSLLLRRECCSFSNGEYVKAGLDELEHWCFWLTEEYAGSAWDELKHIRQAVTLLILDDKHSRSLAEITDDFCPVLSMQQLYRISTMYCDDKFGTLGIPSEVVSSMRTKMIEGSSSSPSAHDDINSFLLDDDFSIPFSVDDFTKLIVHVDVADMDLPPLIQESSGGGSKMGH